MDLLLAEFEAHWGLILIIAYLLGMGTPYPSRSKRKERRNGTPERRRGPSSQLDQIQDLLELITFPNRPADPDKSEDPENGSP